MFSKTKKYLAIVFCIMAIFALAACGSSDGGSDGGVTDNVIYTGKLDAALITNSNGSSVAQASAGSMDMAGDMASVLSTTESAPPKGMLGLAFKMADKAKDALEASIYSSRGASATDTGSMAGNCAGGGGTASYTISYNESTGAFTGTFTFNNFCEDGETSNGTFVLSGVLDLNTGDFTSITLTFVNFAMSGGGETMTVSGSISMSVSREIVSSLGYVYVSRPPTSIYTMSIPDFRMLDGSTGKVYMIRNYAVTIYDFDNFEEVLIDSGDFYDHDEGKVSVATTETINQNYIDDYPNDGVFVVTGLSNTSATLTFINSISYKVDVDSDGNGSIDFTDGPNFW
jgi:hypothetical protein